MTDNGCKRGEEQGDRSGKNTCNVSVVIIFPKAHYSDKYGNDNAVHSINHYGSDFMHEHGFDIAYDLFFCVFVQ